MLATSITVHFASRPHDLPPPPASGRVVVLDLAFAHRDGFERSTLPFINALGSRLALWVDHHDHVMWHVYARRPAFLLVGKLTARACPQLVTSEVVQRAGKVDHIVAHADFDGCMAAAKFLRGGVAPYAEADEDARFSDAPGQGFVCSARGLRLCKALDQARSTLHDAAYLPLLVEVAWALARDVESPELAARLDCFVHGREVQARKLEALLARATRPHPEVLLLSVDGELSSGDKKFLLREMEERAHVGVLENAGWSTVATYDDGEDGLNLAEIKGLQGQRGYAWGKVSASAVLPALVAQLKRL